MTIYNDLDEVPAVDDSVDEQEALIEALRRRNEELMSALREMMAANYHPIGPVNEHGQQDPKVAAYQSAAALLSPAPQGKGDRDA